MSLQNEGGFEAFEGEDEALGLHLRSPFVLTFEAFETLFVSPFEAFESL